MSKVIVVTSGKGGVGKTTTSANLSMALAALGHKTVVIDFDVGLRNIDIVLGCERRVVYDFIHVIKNEVTLNQALIKDKTCDKLYILAASQTKDKDSLTQEGVEKVINELKAAEFDYIICDSPAGIESGAQLAMYFADEAIVVSNPEVSSIRDCDRIIGMLNSKTKIAKETSEMKSHLLITRYDLERAMTDDMLNYQDVLDILELPLIGIIPESKDIITSSNNGRPVALNKESDAGIAYRDLADRVTGKDVDMKYTELVKKGFFKRVFGG
jgi:septum site-determining protein MinD